MNRALVHRGPDEEGSWPVPELGAGLGVRRLSIVDLETGSQPLLTEQALRTRPAVQEVTEPDGTIL